MKKSPATQKIIQNCRKATFKHHKSLCKIVCQSFLYSRRYSLSSFENVKKVPLRSAAQRWGTLKPCLREYKNDWKSILHKCLWCFQLALLQFWFTWAAGFFFIFWHTFFLKIWSKWGLFWSFFLTRWGATEEGGKSQVPQNCFKTIFDLP